MTRSTIQQRQLGTEKRSFSVGKPRAPRMMYQMALWHMILLILQLNVDVADSFSVSFGLGAVLSQPKGLITESARGDVPALLEASEFFVDAFWVSKVGGGAAE